MIHYELNCIYSFHKSIDINAVYHCSLFQSLALSRGTSQAVHTCRQKHRCYSRIRA